MHALLLIPYCEQSKAYEQQQKEIKRAKQSGVTKAKAEAQAKQKQDRRKDKKGKKGAVDDEDDVRLVSRIRGGWLNILLL